MLVKDLFSRLNGKNVTVISKNYGTAQGKKYKGRVISYYFGQGTDMFIELDTGDIINTTFIASIKVVD